MRSSSAAHVVVLPAPVGPVTTTRPRMASAQLITVGGRPSSSASGAEGTTLKTNEAEPRWEKADTRKRPLPLKNEKSEEPFCSYSCSLTSEGITRCFTARVSSGVSASRRGSGISRPATRTRGTDGTFRCRSEAPIRMVSASAESRSKAIGTVIVRPGPGLERLLTRFAGFKERGRRTDNTAYPSTGGASACPPGRSALPAGSTPA